jgi:hypothetical protein
VDVPNIALYAGDPLGPDNINVNLQATLEAGWTTIILSFLHISDDRWLPVPDGGILFYNGKEFINQRQLNKDFEHWNAALTQLKQGTIKKLYLSVGGGDPVIDFQTIKKIYEAAGNTFNDTPLLKNMVKLKELFPIIDGIDMDCEEAFDEPSFLAFCQMVNSIGFDITFCPAFTYSVNFWVNSLKSLTEKYGPQAVKWFNVQCYAGTAPFQWVQWIKAAMPEFDTDDFIVAGDIGRYKDPLKGWYQSCPGTVEDNLKMRKGQGLKSVGGGFIWCMDNILETTKDPNNGCGGIKTMTNYARAISEAMLEGLVTADS